MARTGAGPAYLQLMDERMQPVTRIDLNKEVTRVGRDPEGEVIIDAAAAVVSRRHAEVRKEGDKFTITDLKSFNGTLVNGHRIAESVQLFDGDQIQLGVGGPMLRVVDPANPAPDHRAVEPGAPSPSQQLIPPAFDQIAAMARGATIIATGTGSMPATAAVGSTQPQLLARLSFDRNSRSDGHLITTYVSMDYKSRIITRDSRATTEAFPSKMPARPMVSMSMDKGLAADVRSSFRMLFKSDPSSCRPMRGRESPFTIRGRRPGSTRSIL